MLRYRLTAGLLVMLVPITAAAGLSRLDVAETESGFRVSADAYVDAAPSAVGAVLLDFRHYPALNPSILEASVVAQTGPNTWRVRTATRGCVAGFCRTVRQEQQFVRQSCWEVTAQLVPGTGNLKASRAHWRLTPEANGTQVHWEASFKPDFWLPPILGKTLLTTFLRRDSERFLSGLARVARQVDVTQLETECGTTAPVPRS